MWFILALTSVVTFNWLTDTQSALQKKQKTLQPKCIATVRHDPVGTPPASHASRRTQTAEPEEEQEQLTHSISGVEENKIFFVGFPPFFCPFYFSSLFSFWTFLGPHPTNETRGHFKCYKNKLKQGRSSLEYGVCVCVCLCAYLGLAKCVFVCVPVCSTMCVCVCVYLVVVPCVYVCVYLGVLPCVCVCTLV